MRNFRTFLCMLVVLSTTITVSLFKFMHSRNLYSAGSSSKTDVFWEGPFEGLYLAGGRAGSEHSSLSRSQRACLLAQHCQGVTRVNASTRAFLWQLRIGQGLTLEESPAGEVSYTWRLRKSCFGQNGALSSLEVVRMYYLSEPAMNRKRNLMQVELQNYGFPESLNRSWVPALDDEDLVRWGADIVSGEIWNHMQILRSITLQHDNARPDDWSLVMTHDVRPIIDWNQLLLTIRSAVCNDSDVGFVYLGTRPSGIQISPNRTDVVGSDVYAIRDSIAHVLLHLTHVSASRDLRNILLHRIQLNEIISNIFSICAHITMATRTAFVLRSNILSMSPPRVQFRHVVDKHHQKYSRVQVFWNGPLDSSYLFGGLPGKEYGCVEKAKEACIEDENCGGLTSVPKSKGGVAWQLRLGRNLQVEYSETYEISYIWYLKNVTDSLDITYKPISNAKMEGYPIEEQVIGHHAAAFPMVRESPAKSLDPTRQLQLASGYTFWQNAYFMNNTFVFVQGTDPLDMTTWALMSNAESIHRWGEPGRFASSETRGFGASIVGVGTLVSGKVYTIEPSIMITDFLPGLTPRLYHMLENLLGIWATSKTFMVNSSGGHVEPMWLLLPQDDLAEFGAATKQLISLVYPGIRMLGRKQFKRLMHKKTLQFPMLVASDRSAADHGGVKQMMSGILSHLPFSIRSMVSVVLNNAGVQAATSGTHATIVTVVDRQAFRNRRLGQQHSKDLVWLLGAISPNVHVRWIRYDRLSLREQVQTSADTDLLIGVHGNGLTHVLWIRQPGALVEIFPGNNRIVTYQQLCEIRGILYYGLEASTGAVHREGSCIGARLANGRWYPPADCILRDATIDQVSADLDINQVGCIVYDALFSLKKVALDPRRNCEWPRCVEYLVRSNFTFHEGCVDGSIEYECLDFGPDFWSESVTTTIPNDYCLDKERSAPYCSTGTVLCKALPEPGWTFFLKGLYDWKFCHNSYCAKQVHGEWWRDFLRMAGFNLTNGTTNVEESENHKLCVLLPYRDSCQRLNRARVGERAGHLRKVLQHMQAFLTLSGHASFDFIVVEQTDRGLFNKGALYNFGVNVASHRGCDFIALHDIDHLPMDQRNDYSFPPRPIHLCTNSSTAGLAQFAGGAVLMQMKHFALINGFSNLYNGWGAEDADLYERVKKIFGHFERLDPAIGFYLPLQHREFDKVDKTFQMTETGEDSYGLNLQILERQKGSISRFFMDIDGYMQIRSYLSIVSIREDGNVITATVDVLRDGFRQQRCEDVDKSILPRGVSRHTWWTWGKNSSTLGLDII